MVKSLIGIDFLLRINLIGHMKPFRNVFSLLMLAIFLVPAAGFYYNKHSCSKSGSVQMVLDSEYSCCAVEVESNFDIESSCNAEISEESSCCVKKDEKSHIPYVLDKTEENCCSNEGRYLKTEEDYTSPAKIKLSQIKIHFTIAYFSVQLYSSPGVSIEERAHAPPIYPSSRDLLLRNGILLI